MPVSTPPYASIVEACERAGFAVRGGFRVGAEDRVPPVAGVAASSLVLLGSDRKCFAAFRASDEWGRGQNPLQRFTERVVTGLARALGGAALYPHHGPPWLPFQRWARRAGPVYPSPLGLLIHPGLGLWHAYRAALAFPSVPEGIPPPARATSPCLACDARPSLGSCPVSAFGEGGYDPASCTGHLASGAGRECLEGGCRARVACPVGVAHRYGAEQMRFHMHAFAQAQGVAVPGE